LPFITNRRITWFTTKYPDSRISLINLVHRRSPAEYRNFPNVREVFGSAEQVGNRTVFNISGNKYPLIARLNFEDQRAYVLPTHEEYVIGLGDAAPPADVRDAFAARGSGTLTGDVLTATA
jgi:mRNA interferase HigB